LYYVAAFGKNWLKFKPIYELFSDKCFDLSEEAAYEAFLHESQGKGNHKFGIVANSKNGYIIGKHWMDVTVKMWKEDIQNHLLKKEKLYQDPEFKDFHWWLDRVLK
jgi:hypothetical protein